MSERFDGSHCEYSNENEQKVDETATSPDHGFSQRISQEEALRRAALLATQIRELEECQVVTGETLRKEFTI